VTIRARVGGQGPPLLLLHGNPQTHVMWHEVAPREWASDVRGRALPCGHYLAEELPEETTRELLAFFLGTP
jgi:haloacetate dehalogenase